MNRERLKEVAIRNLARDRGITHRALQYQMNGSTPLNTQSVAIWKILIFLGQKQSKRNIWNYWQFKYRIKGERTKTSLAEVGKRIKRKDARNSIEGSW